MAVPSASDLRTVSPLTYFAKFNPVSQLADRFRAVSEITIDREPSATVSQQSTVRVLSWNIAKNNQDPSWTRDFLSIVETFQPDKIFLQEVKLCAQAQQMPELAEMGWSFAPNFIDRSENAYSGVLIATKSNRISSQALVSQHSEPVTNTPKVSLLAQYGSAQSPSSLLAANTHLINFVDLGKFKAQLRQMEAVLQTHTGPILLAGDFNTWNRYRWELLYKMARRLRLSAVSFSPQENQKLKRFLASPPLDYIFYRGFSQKPATAKVIDTITSSDHNPLLVELERQSF